MNYTKLASSERMQLLLSYLERMGKQGATSYQLTVALECVAPATWVSMLRHNGHDVTCLHEKTDEDGTKTYRYWLAKYAPEK